MEVKKPSWWHEQGLSEKLFERICGLSHKQAIEVIIYFAGFEDGENLVKQALP